MTESVAPRVFVSYAHDSPEHKEQVRKFANLLRARIGLDVHLDRWYDNRRVDWSLWATQLLPRSDFVIAVASPLYRERSVGDARPDEGVGSQFEAMLIRNRLTRNLAEGMEQVLPVVLPGGSVDDIPEFLAPYSATRFEIDEISDTGVEDLVIAITGRGRHPLPARGRWQDGEPQGPIRIARALPWLAASPGVRVGGTHIHGAAYGDSILVRPGDGDESGPAFVEFDLGGAYARLTSTIGIPDDAKERFQVGHFRLLLDGRPQREIRVARGKPRALTADVTGIVKLRLEMWRPATTPGAPARHRPADLAWADPILS